MKTGCKVAIVAAMVMLVFAGQVLARQGVMRHVRGPNAGPGPAVLDTPEPAPPGPPMGPPGPPMLTHAGGPQGDMIFGLIMRQLDLTDEQREQIKGILEANQEGLETAREAVQDATKALHEAVINDAGEADIRAAATGLGTAIGNEAVLRSAMMASVKQVLTPDQLAQLEKIKGRVRKLHQRLAGPDFGAGLGPRPNPLWTTPRLGKGLGMNIEQIFEKLDANKDGKLTKEEIQAVRPQCPLEKLFDKIDTNKDGALTLEELEAFKDQVKDRPRRGQW